MSSTPHHARHHREELSLRESDPRAICPVTGISSKERPHTSPSLIPISDNLNCQKSSSSKIFTLRYFFTLSVQVFVHQKQRISCYSFSCFEFSVPPGKKKKKQNEEMHSATQIWTLYQCFHFRMCGLCAVWKIYAINWEGKKCSLLTRKLRCKVDPPKPVI